MGFPAMPATGGDGGLAALQDLRNHPRFEELSMLVQQNPAMLEQILDSLRQTHPGLAQAISENPEEFLQMLQGDEGDEGDLDDELLALNSMQGHGGIPGGDEEHVFELSEQERVAVERLSNLGFDGN